MADWKQITARIRRARTSKDPAGQLSALYEKTHDAMVAFELAKYFETSAMNADAAKWYSTAAERFRRADWKTKAQEAAVRLGGELGATASSAEASAGILPVPVPVPEPGMPFEQSAAAFEAIVSDAVSELVSEQGATAKSSRAETDTKTESSASEEGSESTAASTDVDSDEKRRRRRGRRGGRNRRKVGSATDSTGSSRQPSTPRRGATSPSSQSVTPLEPEPQAQKTRRPMPPLPVEPLPESTTAGPRGRYGDPGLSSRISLLEMQFRRLLSCEAVKLEEANHAPVGPGVFVLTDSDLTSYYYVESCQTLRIAVANLLRGNASRRGAESITKQLAEHLGITEARVPKYLAEHCVVRWLQLDEGASHFAHFVIAVLRPVLNE
jgi:hypothetical protein